MKVNVTADDGTVVEYEDIQTWSVDDNGLLLLNVLKKLTEEEKQEYNRAAMRNPGGMRNGNEAPKFIEMPCAAWASGKWMNIDVIYTDEELGA